MKVKYIIMAAAVALGLQGCSDWDDHYDANGDNIAGANATLWEQINSRPDLSNFAALLKKEGYDEVLNSNQSYTVWAPSNESYDFETYNAMSDSLLKAEFLNNHIARGYHRASGNTSERIHLLNKKTSPFAGDGDYTLGGLAIDSTNIISKNGVLHLLDGMMDFRPNFYEFFNREHKDGFSSANIGDLFKSNMKREMDKDKSVEGPIKDGEITYLDTVYVESNKWFDLLNAQLTNEDSTYTMIIPSDVAWEKAYKHIEPYFNFPTTIQPFKLENDEITGVLTYTIDGSEEISAADTLKKTYTQLGILSSLPYSNTVNPALRDEKLPTQATDSIKSTTGTYEYNTLNFRDPNSTLVWDAKDLFTDTKKEILSNGVAYLTGDSLYMKTWTNVNPTMRVRAMSGSNQAGVSNVSLAQNVTLNEADRNPNVHGSIHATAFYQVTSNINSQPQVYFYGPAVNSTAYAVYLTMIPQNITDTTAVPTDLRVQVRSLSHGVTGNAPAKLSTGLPSFSNLKRDFTSNLNFPTVTFNFGTKDDARIVTKYMGVYKPSICYKGLDTSHKSRPIFNVNCTTRTMGGSTVLRIAAITFVPQEAVEYYMKEGYIDSYNDDMPEMFWNLPTSIN